MGINEYLITETIIVKQVIYAHSHGEALEYYEAMPRDNKNLERKDINSKMLSVVTKDS